MVDCFLRPAPSIHSSRCHQRLTASEHLRVAGSGRALRLCFHADSLTNRQPSRCRASGRTTGDAVKTLFAALIFLLSAVSWAPAQNRALTIASTTSVEDSGLFAALLPKFES